MTNKLYFFYILILIIPSYIALIVIVDTLNYNSNRILYMLEALLNNPHRFTLIILHEGSINDRFLSIYFSIKGSFENYLLPNGYVEWQSYFASALNHYDGFISVYVSKGTRILSGYGSAIFELGAVGLIIPIVISVIVYKYYNDKVLEGFFFMFLLHLMLINAMPLAIPLLSFIVGYMIYVIEKRRIETPNNSQ